MLRRTGGQVDAMVMALVDAANDKHEDVRQAICSSLQTLGIRQPELVLSCCSVYLHRNPKLAMQHRILILITMQRVCTESLELISQDLAIDIIKQATEEMISSKEVVPEWQGAASGILVALGVRFCHEVMEVLLTKYQPGVMPHFFVMQTLGNLASANVYGIVPFLKAVLGTLLSMLGLVRHDNMKWVMSFAIARFTEAILDYLANIDKAPDPTVKKDVYASEVGMAYDVLIGNWLHTKEPKLHIVVVEAIGYITNLMSHEKLEEQIPRLIPNILSLYKRHPDPYIISQSLCMVLDAIVKNQCSGFESQLENVVHVLFPQVCTIPDFTKPVAVKNHNEILRCFCVLTQAYSDFVVQMLLNSLENNNEKIRIGSLMILRHLVNTADSQISHKMPTILGGLKSVLHESSNKVKKVCAHLVVALAHHGYLELDGSTFLIEFIVRQSSLGDEVTTNHKRTQDPEHVTNDALRAMCDNILNLLTTTVQGMEKVLWPHLLEYIIPDKYTNAVAVVCKSAAMLASRMRETSCSETIVDYEKNGNIPEPTALVARLVVLLGHPMAGRQRGLPILKLMKALVPSLDRNLVALWDTQIPQLCATLTDTAENGLKFEQGKWEKAVLELLSRSLDEVDQEIWTTHLGEALATHLQLYSTASDDKSFLLKCMGVILKRATDKQFITHHLSNIFSVTQHSVPQEREGCAEAFGRASAMHLDVVLQKLDQLTKVDCTRKSSGILSFLMESRSEPDHDLAKATLILCYGSVALHSQSLQLAACVESSVTSRIMPYFNNVKDVDIKVSLLQCVDKIAQALHPSLVKDSFVFLGRKEMFQHIQNILRSEGVNDSSRASSNIRVLAINCFANLFKLNPSLVGPEREPFIRTCLESVLPLKPFDKITDKGSIQDVDVCMDSLNNLLEVMLLRDATPDNFYALFSILESWLQSEFPNERQRSISSVASVLQSFLNSITLGIGKPSNFAPLGAVLARLVPRCTDPDILVRETAVVSMLTTFRISAVYEGHSKDYTDKTLETLIAAQSRVDTDDSMELFEITKQLGQVIAAKLPVHQVAPFLHVLFEGLLDNQMPSSSGVCVVFNIMIKSRGGELHQQVEVVLKLLHHRLNLISCKTTRKGALQVLRTLASHHLAAVVNFLLSCPLPFDSSVSDCWKVLAQDPELGANILEQLLELIARIHPHTEHNDPRNSKAKIFLANPQTLAAVIAMREMLRIADMERCSVRLFSRLYSSLLLLCGVFVGTFSPPSSLDAHKGEKGLNSHLIIVTEKKVDRNSPVRTVIETFQAFLLCSKQEALLNQVTNLGCWQDMESMDKYPEAVAVLTSALVEFDSQFVLSMVASLNPALNSLHDAHRIVAIAVFAELINQRCCGDAALLEILLNNLVASLVDTSATVRKLCIRGLGHVGSVGADQVHKYSTTVLSAMLAGLDDKDDSYGDITLEAMSGLSKVMSEIDPGLVTPVLINISLRIRSCFENVRPDIRAAAFTLFGDLSKFGRGEQSPFVEQVHSNLVALLLHLNDEDKRVIKSCKYALRLVGPLIGSETANNMFQKHLLDDAVLHYGEFMNDLNKTLIMDFPDKIALYTTINMVYFKSSWPIIQSNAALCVGYLLGNLPVDRQTTVTKEPVCTALVLLLKDQSKEVRVRAAEAMSLLYSY